MHRTTPAALPPSPEYAAALAHIADLRAEAAQAQLARAARRAGGRPAWPSVGANRLRQRVAAALRAPVAALRGDRDVRGASACPSC